MILKWAFVAFAVAAMGLYALTKVIAFLNPPRPGHPEPLLLAMEKVAEAREAAAGNVNPQVLLAVLGEDLAEVL